MLDGYVGKLVPQVRRATVGPLGQTLEQLDDRLAGRRKLGGTDQVTSCEWCVIERTGDRVDHLDTGHHGTFGSQIAHVGVHSFGFTLAARHYPHVTEEWRSQADATHSEVRRITVVGYDYSTLT